MRIFDEIVGPALVAIKRFQLSRVLRQFLRVGRTDSGGQRLVIGCWHDQTQTDLPYPDEIDLGFGNSLGEPQRRGASVCTYDPSS